MRNEATGGLIAVIGDDNDDFSSGPAARLCCPRDGVLFLGLTEGELTDNTGTYDVVIEAEAGSAHPINGKRRTPVAHQTTMQQLKCDCLEQPDITPYDICASPILAGAVLIVTACS